MNIIDPSSAELGELLTVTGWVHSTCKFGPFEHLSRLSEGVVARLLGDTRIATSDLLLLHALRTVCEASWGVGQALNGCLVRLLLRGLPAAILREGVAQAAKFVFFLASRIPCQLLLYRRELVHDHLTRHLRRPSRTRVRSIQAKLLSLFTR